MIQYFIKTYGCQANVADSQGVAKFLNDLGSVSQEKPEHADLIIVNTCAVRDKAEQKLFSYLGELSDIKRQRPHVKIGVIGCVASYKKDEIYHRFDQVNFVYGARDDFDTFKAYLADISVKIETAKQLLSDGQGAYSYINGQDRDIKKLVKLKGMLNKRGFSGFRVGTVDKQGKKSSREISQAVEGKKPKELNRSFVNITTGCNKCCAYCIVPFTRGGEVSYPMEDLIKQVAHDVANGAKEVTLIGQNVNSYIDPETGKKFPELLRRVAELDGDFWIRYVSPHPQDMTRDLFEVMAEYRPKVAPYIHFPVQSGSSRILGLMKRNHSIEKYLEQINWIWELIPDATISTDIIVGFPGETEEDYQATRQLMETVKFDWIYSFIFSPRKYTLAARMTDNTTKEEKTRRLMELQKRQKEICLERNSRHVGKTMKCLVEKRLANGKLLARTEGNLRTLFNGGDELIDTFIDLRILKATPAHVEAEVLND